MSNTTSHDEVLSILSQTYKAKNADYGDSFTQTCDRFGLTAAMVRMSDKWNRLVNLAKQVDEAQVKDESLDDTLLDLANYAIMTYMWRKNRGGYGSNR